MNLQQISALAQAGFSKADIMALVGAGQPVQQAAQQPVQQAAQQPGIAELTAAVNELRAALQPTCQAQTNQSSTFSAMGPGQTMDLTGVMQTIYAQAAQMDMPPQQQRTAEVILEERLKNLCAVTNKPQEGAQA